MYCDLHGHSRNKNVFIYGNNNPQEPIQTRLFPFLLSKLCDFFSFEDCRFSNNMQKESTARVSMWRELQIPNVFTVEASFCGANKGEEKNKHFQVQQYAELGERLLLGILIYFKVNLDK